MSRVLRVVAVVIVAGIVAFVFSRGDGAGPQAVDAIEKRLASGDTKAARAELDEAWGNLHTASRDYLDGLIRLTEGDDAGALTVLERAYAVRPDDWRIVSTLASAAGNLGRFDRAMQAVELYLASHPDDERALAQSAQLLLHANNPSRDAAKALERLKRIEALPRRVAAPGDRTAIDDERVRGLRSRAEADLGHTQAAVQTARKTVVSRPGDAAAWALLGDLERRGGHIRQAVDAYRRATELAPSERRYREQLVLMLLEFGGSADELMALTGGLLAEQPDEPRLLVLRARALVRNRDDKLRPDEIDKANDIYIALLKRDLPIEIRRAVLRNRSVLLLDWMAGAKAGEYLDDSYDLMKEYLRLGGEIDDEIRDAWNKLQERTKKR